MDTKEKSQKSKVIFEFSAGGAVYRQKAVQEWLLIQPQGTNRWQLPKGKIDQGEKSENTAVREVFEETGVRAVIIEKIEVIKYFYMLHGNKISKRVTFYIMKSDGEDSNIKDEWKHEIAEAKWCGFEEALNLLSFKSEKDILRKGSEILKTH